MKSGFCLAFPVSSDRAGAKALATNRDAARVFAAEDDELVARGRSEILGMNRAAAFTAASRGSKFIF